MTTLSEGSQGPAEPFLQNNAPSGLRPDGIMPSGQEATSYKLSPKLVGNLVLQAIEEGSTSATSTVTDDTDATPNVARRTYTFGSTLYRNIAGILSDTLLRPLSQSEEPLPPIDNQAELTPDPVVGERLHALKGKVCAPFNNDTVIPTMFKLAERLNPHLASYDLVVGDDTSGRLPAILYWRLVNARRQELGLPPSAVRFMSGQYSGETLPEGAVPAASTDSARTLIVTEYVCSGASVMKIYRAITGQGGREGKRVDIAAVGSSMKQLPLLSGANFYTVDSATEEKVDKYLYGYRTYDAKGVSKRDGKLHSNRVTNEDGFKPALVARARRDVNLIGDEFYALLPSVPPQKS